MADYYPLLAKAVSGLPDSTEETRRAIYERARKALLGQLRKIEPPIPEEDIARENSALDEAVARLEGEIAGKAAAASVAASPETSAPPAAEATPAAPESAPAAPKPKPTTPPRLTMPPRPPTPAPAAPPKPFSFRAPTPPAGAAPAAEAAGEPRPAEDAATAEAPKTAESPDAIETGAPADLRPPRPRSDVRPSAPAPEQAGSRSKRLWIVGGVVAAIVLLVAGLAFKLRDQSPQGLAKLGQTPPAEQPQQSGKIVERADKPANAPQQAPAQPSQTAPGQPQQQQPPVPVAHRAALLIDAPDLPDKVKTYIGSVVWRLDSVPTGAGRPLGTAVHADVDIPEAKLRMSLDIQKNLDDSLPASHTINVNFTILAGSEIPGIKQIGAIQMRREDASNGEGLAGVPVQITDTAYLIGLARGDFVVRNMDLLKNRGWLDLPLALSNGRIAKFSLEKGASGTRVIADAIQAWDMEK
ncbi:MAG: hypothetical protein U1E28_19490 [Beijerinckiaceae bacterium]